MEQKTELRKKYLNLRKRKYFDIDKVFFLTLLKLIRLKFKTKFIKIALYYPSNFELNVLKILDLKYFSEQTILLPGIEKNNSMKFYPWKKNNALTVKSLLLTSPSISV